MFTNPNEVRHASVQMQAYIWSYAEQLRQLTKQSLCCDQVRGAWHLYMLLSSCASPWWPETHRKRTYMWEYIICKPNMLYCTILYLIGLLYRHTIITSYNFDRGGGLMRMCEFLRGLVILNWSRKSYTSKLKKAQLVTVFTGKLCSKFELAATPVRGRHQTGGRTMGTRLVVRRYNW